MSPMPGIFCIVLFSVLFISPAMRERLPVLQLDFGLGAARRQRRDAEASSTMALLKSSELTSGLTLRLIRSPPSTVGVK